MKAAIYARYSAGPRQTDQSIEGQLRECHAFCERKGLEVVAEYCDRHISGKTDARPEFQRMIADAKRKLFDAVVVYKTDRFARNRYDGALYKSMLKKNSVAIFYAAENIPDGPEGIILESLMEGLAEYYSAELAQKIKRGMHENALKAKSNGSGIPLGYKVDPETKRFILDPEGAEAVRIVFDRYNAGESAAAICAFLNDRGLRTARKKPFNKNSVNRIISNRKYLGEYSYNGVTIPDGMPRIVSEEVFAMAQAEMEKRKKRRTPPAPKGEYLLAGKLFCGHCKAGLVGVSGTSRGGKKFYYYYCPNNRAPKKDCCKTQVPRDVLEDRVAEITLEYILTPEILKDVSHRVWELQSENDRAQAERAFYERQLKATTEAIDNMLDAIVRGVEITDEFNNRFKSLSDEKLVLEGEVARLSKIKPNFKEDEVLFALMHFTDRLEGETDQDYRRRVIQCFVSDVYLWNDKVTIFFNILAPEDCLLPDDLAEIENAPVDLCSTSALFGGANILLVEHITPYGFAVTLFFKSNATTK